MPWDLSAQKQLPFADWLPSNFWMSQQIDHRDETSRAVPFVLLAQSVYYFTGLFFTLSNVLSPKYSRGKEMDKIPGRIFINSTLCPNMEKYTSFYSKNHWSLALRFLTLNSYQNELTESATRSLAFTLVH